MVMLAFASVVVAAYRFFMSLRYYEKVVEDLYQIGDIQPSLHATLALIMDALLLASAVLWFLGVPAT